MTWRLLRDAIDAEPRELDVKGKAKPVQAWRLLALRPGAPPFAPRADAPLVGREDELRTLREAFAEVVESGTAQLITLLGPAGIGKTRLGNELLGSLGDDARTLLGRCLPYGDGITFWPLLEIVRQLGDDPRDALAEALAGEADGPVIAERVLVALGLGGTAGNMDETFWGFRRLFETLARERPLILVFEDLHWAEPALLELVEQLVEHARDSSLLVLGLARPELLEERPQWRDKTTSLALEPLSDADSQTLIDALLGAASLEAELRRRIVEAAEGNPLFVEQMLAMVALGETTAGELEVPPTIRALLAARLDRLGPGERAVVETAAVIGKEFSRDAVAALLPAEAGSSLDRHLQAIVRKEFVRPATSADKTFRFRHILILDAAYRGISKAERAGLHEGFADWLEARVEGQAPELDEILGHHLEQAYRYRLELGPPDEQARALARSAAERLATAGRRAVARDDMGAAHSLLSRAQSLLDPGERLSLEFAPELAEAMFEAGEQAEAEALLAKTIERARDRGEPGLEAHARIQQAYMRHFTRAEDTGDEALQVAEEAVPIFEEGADAVGMAKAARLAFWVHLGRGQFAVARKGLELALAHVAQAGELSWEAQIRGQLVASHFWGDTHLDAFEPLCRQYLDWASANGVRRGILYGVGHLAVSRALRGDSEEARRLWGEAIRAFEELEPGITVATGKGEFGGWIEELTGDPAAAERVQREAYETLEALGESGFRSTLAGELAHSIYAQGRYDEVDRFAQISKEAARSDDVASQTLWRGARSMVLARRGQFDEAELLARDAVRIIDGTELVLTRPTARIDLAEVLRLAGKRDEAAAVLREAVDLYEQKGAVVMAERTRALLEGVHLGAPVS
jgi:tetratricopeptide (TPR) repeat protein